MSFTFSKSPFFLILSVVLLASFSACGFFQNDQNNAPAKDPDLAGFSTNIPFANKEPEVFQTEIIVSTFINGEKNVRNYFTARKNGNVLTKFGDSESKLQTSTNRIFAIDHKRKTFTETSAENAFGGEADEIGGFLTTKWLNEKASPNFKNLGTQNNLTKYLVKLGDSQNSEILIFVDENLKLPVKQEFYSIAGEKKDLTYAVELKNFKPQADDKLFEIPKDYREIE